MIFIVTVMLVEWVLQVQNVPIVTNKISATKQILEIFYTEKKLVCKYI